MKYSDAEDLISQYVKTVYGREMNWDIVITTPYKKSNRTDSANGYKLFVHKDGVANAIAESDELFGYRRNTWTGDAYGKFLGTLKSCK